MGRTPQRRGDVLVTLPPSWVWGRGHPPVLLAAGPTNTTLPRQGGAGGFKATCGGEDQSCRGVLSPPSKLTRCWAARRRRGRRPVVSLHGFGTENAVFKILVVFLNRWICGFLSGWGGSPVGKWGG